MSKLLEKREEILPSDCWNIEALYASFELWEEDFAKIQPGVTQPYWPNLTSFKDRLKDSPDILASFLKQFFLVERQLSKLHAYAHMRHDEDMVLDKPKQAYMRITSLYHTFENALAWFQPELLQIEAETMALYLKNDSLKEFEIYLRRMLRAKPHTLSAKEEELLAGAGLALETASRAFSSFNNADLKFPDIYDENGLKHELTKGQYMQYMTSQDRTLRKSAFVALNQAYSKYENTLCELINGQVEKHVFYAKTRQHASALEAALFPIQVDKQLYLNLIQSTHRHLPVLHKYLDLRKRLLKVETLHVYDLHVPLISSIDLSMSYSEAESLVIESVALLGNSYQSTLKQGLLIDRWVDRYENINKRSGAYSGGCYDGFPYILLNYKGKLQDVMTLAHEAGHSMHSLLSHRNQSYHNASYPIFVAEVASTFNEELVFRSLLEKTTDRATKASLINQKIEDIRNTFFRQTMFAEFELQIHTLAEQKITLTPTLLKSKYRELNASYFGSSVILDEEIDIEWARIPHFYYNFYVFQYATGIAAALALVDKVIKDGPDRYLRFLSAGATKYPLELLNDAGVDMLSVDPIKAIIDHFNSLIDELAILTEN
jgi:oligoendopeptidase F